MKSLVLSRFRPDLPSGGASLRNLQTIYALAQLGEVDVLTIGLEPWQVPTAEAERWIAFDTPSLTAQQSIFERAKRKLRRRAGWVHPIVDNFSFDAVRRVIRERTKTKRYDVAVIEEIPLVDYFEDLAVGTVIYDAHNVETNLRPVGQDRARLMKHEGRIVQSADLTWCCSANDATELSRLFGSQRPIDVIPNGVDVNQYIATTNAYSDWSNLPLTILYPAIFSYRPNHEAALFLINRVLPELARRGRKSRLLLVGRNPQPELVDLARDRSDILVTGAVESVLPYFQGECVLGLPIFSGSGTRLKILEAFASRRAVVTTAKGCEGLACRHGEELLVCEDEKSFAESLIHVWDSPSERRRIGENARSLVERNYSWQTAALLIKNSLQRHVDIV